MLSVRFEGNLQEVLGQMREFIGLVTKDAPVQYVRPEEQAIPQPKSAKGIEKKVEKSVDEAPPTPVEPSLDEVKAMSVKLAKAKGRQTVVDLLKEFGAQSGADVKEADRAAYIAKAQSIIPA